jgi:hypothetical protein
MWHGTIKRLSFSSFHALRSGFYPVAALACAFALTGCEGLLISGSAKNKNVGHKKTSDTDSIPISVPSSAASDTIAPSAATSLGWAQSSPYNSTAAAVAVYKDVALFDKPLPMRIELR